MRYLRSEDNPDEMLRAHAQRIRLGYGTLIWFAGFPYFCISNCGFCFCVAEGSEDNLEGENP